MKCKIIKTLSCLITFVFILLSIFSLTTVSVADSDYIIEVIDKEYKFLKTVGSENQNFNYYTIIIKLKNNGINESDDITIKIWEKQEDVNISIRRNGIIKAGETMEFWFEDWIVYGIGEHMVMYEYHPTNISKMNNYNSGAGSFKITDGSIKDEKTPGFELILVLLSFAFIYLIKKRKR